jgi:hypothetical protein
MPLLSLEPASGFEPYVFVSLCNRVKNKQQISEENELESNILFFILESRYIAMARTTQKIPLLLSE